MKNVRVNVGGGFEGAKLARRGKLRVNAGAAKRKNDGSALGYLGTKTAYGLAWMGERFSDWVRGNIYQLAGDKEYAQYLHEKDIVGEWTAKLDREYNPTGAMKVVGDVAFGVGQALPSVAVGIATGGTSAAAQVVGAVGQAAVTMAYMGGGVTDAVKTTGELGAKENKYGIASGLLEGVTDKFFGGAQMAGKALVTAGKSATKVAAGKVARNTLMKHMLSAAGSEALEEFVQEYADAYLRRKTGVDKDAQTSLSDAMYSALIGGLTGGFLGGAAGSVNAAMNIRRGESIKARGLENSLLATANYIRKDYIGEKANFDNIQSASLRALSASVDAYDKLSDKSGTRASMLLGEIQMATLAFESEVGVRRVMNQMMQNPTEALAAHASTVMGRPVTVEELRNNVDGITEQFAVQSFATGALTESSTDRKVNAIKDRVVKERYMHVREGASFDGTLSAEGELVYRMNDGRYAIVTADQREGNEGKYRVGFSATPEYDPDDILMSQKSATVEDIREGLKGLADGTYVVGENGLERAQTSKNAPASDGGVIIEQTPAEIANEAQRAENVGEGASDNDSKRSALPKTREAKERKRKRAQEHQRQSREKRKAERMAEAMREEVVRNAEQNAEVNAEQGTEAAQETVEKEKIPARGYTDAEANDARALVKDFDLLPAASRRAIVELMRSGKASGASKNFLRHSANLIAYWRKGLWIIADDKTRDDGFYYVLDDGTRLITVNPKREAKAVSETLMHELAHDVWARADAEIRKTLYKLATAGVDQKEIEEIREQYRTELTNRGELTKRDADGNTVDMTEAEINALLDEEVATNLLGETIGTEEFLSRFDGEGKFAAAKRIWRTLYNMKKRFTGKDRFLYRKADDLFKTFTKVMAVEEVEGGTAEPGKRHMFVGRSAETADKLKLSTAQEMLDQGIDSETVRKETGWFRGYDGKWRFEISDFESSLIENPKLEKHTDDGEVYFTGKLSDILDHTELFAAYPELKDINIIIQKTDFGVYGIYQPNSNYITLSIEHFKRATKAYYEYANGGRKAEIERIEATPEYQEYNNFYEKADTENMDPQEWLQQEKELRDRFFNSDLGKRYYQLMWGKDGFTGDKYEFGWGTGGKETLLHELQHAVQNIEGFASGTSTRNADYSRNAGEIEARDTESRVSLTQEQRKNTRPDIDRKDVVFAKDGVAYYKADRSTEDEDIKSIKEQLNKAKDKLLAMTPIKSKELPRTFKKAKDALEWAVEVLKSSGELIQRQGYGDIVLDEKRLKNGLSYLKTDMEKVAFSLIPKVMKNGIEIGRHPKHKGRNYDTVTFAAPVTVGTTTGHMAVVVREEGKKYYKLHRVFMPDGSYFEFQDEKRSNAETAGLQSANLSPTNIASDISIPQNSQKSTDSKKKVLENNGTGRRALPKKPKSQTTEKKARLTKEEKADEYKKVMDTIDENEGGYHTRLDYQKISEALDRRAREKAKAQAKSKTKRPPEDEITRENFEKAVAAERERLEREAAERILAAEKGAENATKNAEKRLEAEKNRIEKEASVLFNRTSREISKLDKNLQYLKHMASHQKATDGSIAAAVLLNDPVLQKFVSFLGKRGSAWGVMHKSTREGVREFLSWYKEDNAVLNDETVDKLYDDMGLKSDAIFGHYSAEIRAKMERIANGEGNLTAAELSDLAEVVNSLGRLYMTYGKVKVGGRWVDAKELAREHYAERSEARRVLVAGRDIDGKPGAIKKLWQVLGSVKEGYLYSVVTPEVVLKDLEGNVKGGVLSSLYREIRLGEAEAKKIRVEILKPVAEFFEEHKAYRKKLSTDRRFEVNGLKLTTAQAVGLWETSKREHAQQRLFDTENGGIYAAVPDEEGNITSRNTKVTRADIENLFHEFTEEDIAYINALEESFRIATKYKEQTDGEVWGYTNVIKGHYYPITPDENYFSRDITDVRDAMRTIEVVNNKSFNKNTVDGAQAWLFIEDSLKVLERHSLGIGTYSGLYLPLKAFGQVYGAKFNKAGAPTDKGDADVLLMESAVGKTSLRQYYNAIWSKHGKSGGNLDKYLAKLFSDIQGITGEVSGIDRVVNKLQSGMVVSSFGLNAKVILTQLASYGAAYKNLDADVLVQAVTMHPEGEMMDKYSKLTLARDFDGVGAAEVLLDKISDFGRKTTKGIDFTDRQVILALYNACRLQVEKDGGGALGDEQNYKKAAEMLDNLLLDTQTTSLKSDASALMRDKSLVAKMFTMFRTESMKSFSNFYTSIAAYANHRQYAGAGLEGYAEMLDEDKKRISKTAGAFLLSTAWVSALSIAFSRIRKKARGEEEEEKLVKQAAKEITGNVVELFPIISDAYSFLADGYELEAIPISAMNDALTSLRGVGILFDRTATDAEKNKYIRNSAYSVGSLVGIPNKNADRIGLAIITATNQSTAYLWNNRFKTAPTYEKDLEKALSSGNERLAGTILSAWWKNKKGGKSSDTVTEELLRLYTLKDGNGKEIFSMPKSVPSSLDQKTAAAFSSVYAGADAEVVSLIGSKAYAALDDAAKAKAVKACYDIHWSRAAQAVGLESTGSAARLASAEGVDPAILAAVTGYASAHTGENRKAHIIQYLISLGVSLQDRNKYLSALGYKVS